MPTIIESLYAELGFKLTGQQNLKRFQRSLDGLNKQMANVSAGFALAAKAASAALGAFGLGALAKDVIKTGNEFEKLELTLTFLEGSAKKASERMEWLRKFAIDTPLDLKGATAAYVKLKNFGIDPTNGSLQALVDSNAMMAGGQEQLEGIILAIGQAWTKQKFQAEEANQLLERGVPAWELLSQAMGKSTKEVQELSEKGKIGRKEMQLLINAMGKRSRGASEKFAKTLQGTWDKVTEQWTDFKKQVNDAGFLDEVRMALDRVRAALVSWEKSGGMKRAAKAISDFLSSIVRGMQRAADWVRDWVNKNGSAIDKFWEDFQKKSEGLNWIETANLIIKELLDALAAGSGPIGLFWKDLREAIGSNKGWNQLGTTIGMAIADGLMGAANYIQERIIEMFPTAVQPFVRDMLRSIGGSPAHPNNDGGLRSGGYGGDPYAGPGQGPGFETGPGGAAFGSGRRPHRSLRNGAGAEAPAEGSGQGIRARAARAVGVSRYSDSNEFYGAIQRAEGTTVSRAYQQGDPHNTVLGHGRYGLPDKPLTSMTLREAYEFGQNTVRPAHRRDQGGRGSSALGAYQIVGSTMKQHMPEAGLTWDSPFNAENQKKLASVIARREGLKAWEGFKLHPRERERAAAALRAGQDRDTSARAIPGRGITHPAVDPDRYQNTFGTGRPAVDPDRMKRDEHPVVRNLQANLARVGSDQAAATVNRTLNRNSTSSTVNNSNSVGDIHLHGVQQPQQLASKLSRHFGDGAAPRPARMQASPVA